MHVVKLIYPMSPLVVIILFYHLTYTVHCGEVTYVFNRHLLAGFPPQAPPKEQETNEAKADPKKEEITIDVKSKGNEVQPAPPQPHETPPEVKKAKSTTEAATKNDTKVEDHKIFKTTEMESGALLRGVSVVVVLTTIVILYLALKTYCGKKNKHPVMVSKYGVRTRRSDIEMTPLPLDEDEEDETLFEVHNTNR